MGSFISMIAPRWQEHARQTQIGSLHLKYKRNKPSNKHFNVIQPCATCIGSSEPLSGSYITKV